MTCGCEISGCLKGFLSSLFNTMTEIKNFIFTYENVMELGRGAAEFFLKHCLRETERKGLFTVVLSGGNTPYRLYTALASSEFREKIPWDRVHLFWGDERCVGPEHPESNFGLAYRALISRVDIPRDNVHRIKAELTPAEAALDYEAEIRRFFNVAGGPPVFDLAFLGLGDDGHTLSLYPATKALSEEERLVVENYVDKLGAYRVTMTLPLVNNAAFIIFLVSGKGKSGVLKQVLSDAKAGCPAQLIRPRTGEVRWLIDRGAASELVG